jgi:hypothetical protein
MRKSPIRHHVRKHRRSGRPVRDYERGHGSRPAKPRLRRNAQSSGSFMVHIAYASQAPETFPVNAFAHAVVSFSLQKCGQENVQSLNPCHILIGRTPKILQNCCCMHVLYSGISNSNILGLRAQIQRSISLAV